MEARSTPGRRPAQLSALSGGRMLHRKYRQQALFPRRRSAARQVGTSRGRLKHLASSVVSSPLPAMSRTTQDSLAGCRDEASQAPVATVSRLSGAELCVAVRHGQQFSPRPHPTPSPAAGSVSVSKHHHDEPVSAHLCVPADATRRRARTASLVVRLRDRRGSVLAARIFSRRRHQGRGYQSARHCGL